MESAASSALLSSPPPPPSPPPTSDDWVMESVLLYDELYMYDLFRPVAALAPCGADTLALATSPDGAGRADLQLLALPGNLAARAGSGSAPYDRRDFDILDSCVCPGPVRQVRGTELSGGRAACLLAAGGPVLVPALVATEGTGRLRPTPPAPPARLLLWQTGAAGSPAPPQPVSWPGIDRGVADGSGNGCGLQAQACLESGPGAGGVVTVLTAGSGAGLWTVPWDRLAGEAGADAWTRVAVAAASASAGAAAAPVGLYGRPTSVDTLDAAGVWRRYDRRADAGAGPAMEQRFFS